MNYTAELPLGRGKAHLSEGVVGKVLEGWSLAGISTFSVGTPFEIFDERDSDGTGSTAACGLQSDRCGRIRLRLRVRQIAIRSESRVVLSRFRRPG